MRAKILTLRFSPQLGRFDDGPLVQLQQKVVLEHVREHLVQVGEETMLLCLLTWRERAGTAAAATPSAPPTPAPAAAEAPTPPPERAPATPLGELRADFTPEQQALFDAMRAWRRRTAHDEGVPPYVVLTNRQLVEIVQQRPHSKAALGEIRGLGDKKLARHGAAILAMLWPDAPSCEADADVAAAVASAVAGAVQVPA